MCVFNLHYDRKQPCLHQAPTADFPAIAQGKIAIFVLNKPCVGGKSFLHIRHVVIIILQYINMHLTHSGLNFIVQPLTTSIPGW